jgi:hypothetical protein
VKCPACGGTRYASEYTLDGIVYKCLNDGTTFTAEAFLAPEEPFDAPPPRAERKVSAPKAFATSRDVVREAKAQLRELEAEIKRLQKLIPQRDALKRLLAAASQESARAKAVAKK